MLRTILSCTESGDKVDLWTQDDGSGRQRWYLVPIPESNLYNIRVAGGTANGRIWLSVTCAGDHADLWTKDDSGRQRWSIHSNPAIPNGYNTRVHNGTDSGRVIFSTTETGDKVDLWTEDDGSGRQKWRIEPVGDTVGESGTPPQAVSLRVSPPLPSSLRMPAVFSTDGDQKPILDKPATDLTSTLFVITPTYDRMVKSDGKPRVVHLTRVANALRRATYAARIHWIVVEDGAACLDDVTNLVQETRPALKGATYAHAGPSKVYGNLQR